MVPCDGSVEQSALCADPAWGFGSDEDATKFRLRCNVLDFLQKHKGMDRVAAKAFRKQRMCIKVSRAVDDGCADLRSLDTSLAIINKDVADGQGPNMLIVRYEYHHRIRWYEIEHFARFLFAVKSGTQQQMKGKMFYSHDSDRAVHFNSKLRGKRPIDFVEDRNFNLTEQQLQAMQQVLGEGWSGYDTLLLLFTALGVAYNDGKVHTNAPAHVPILRNDWLEHYVRECCGLSDVDVDNGDSDAEGAQEWETESLTDMFNKAVSDFRDYNDDEGDSGRYISA